MPAYRRVFKYKTGEFLRIQPLILNSLQPHYWNVAIKRAHRRSTHRTEARAGACSHTSSLVGSDQQSHHVTTNGKRSNRNPTVADRIWGIATPINPRCAHNSDDGRDITNIGKLPIENRLLTMITRDATIRVLPHCAKTRRPPAFRAGGVLPRVALHAFSIKFLRPNIYQKEILHL